MREMKDSGLKSIGVIPMDWDVVRVKHVASGITDGTHGTFQRVSEGRLLLSAKNVFEDGLHISENESMISESDFLSITQNGYPKANDILLCCVGTIGRSLLYKLSEPIAFQRSVIFIRPNNSIIPAFLNYAIQCESTVTQENVMVNQSAQPGLYQGSVRELKIPYPQISEQKRIASFLDRKCAEIDALTEDIETQIETLEQYKRSVITEAVTKGLDPDVEMKDSGVEWIDKIPSTWKESRIGYLSWLRARLGWKGLKADEYVDEGFPFLSAFNIQDSHVVWNNLNFISKERFDESPEIKLHIGDIILVKDGAGIGKCARIDSLPVGESTSNGSLAVITPYVDLEYRYLFYYFLSSVFQNYILRIMNGMGVPHLSQEELRKIVIPQPPVPIQKQIADYLDSKCAEIDDIIAVKRTQLETLTEYKKSVIYEYVTGKKEVPST